MIDVSTAKGREPVQHGKGTDHRFLKGAGAKARANTITRIAGHTFLPFLIGPESVVLDIGANQGQFTQRIVHDFGCRVHAVEANLSLCIGLQELAIPGVTVHGVAIANSRGHRPFLVMNNSEASRFASASEANAGTVQVQAVTLEDLISRIAVRGRIDLIKMDIEGAELAVLEGAPVGLLERIGQFTVEFHQFVDPCSRVRVEGIKKRFRALGFWVIDFSRTNYDVLFVHPAANLTPGVRASVILQKYYLRIGRGFSYWWSS